MAIASATRPTGGCPRHLVPHLVPFEPQYRALHFHPADL